MKLYLVRHGNAEAGSNDLVRPLSREGIDEVKRVAEFLKTHGAQVNTVYHRRDGNYGLIEPEA